MRSFVQAAGIVALCVGCGGPVTPGEDAGKPHDSGEMALDGGDPGLSCTPGAFFCAAGAVWACTLSGKDAALEDPCIRGAGQGSCSATPCDGGTSSPAAFGALWCCLP